MKRSRSHVYSRALAEYVGRHAPDHITEVLDRVIAEITNRRTSLLARRRAASCGGVAGEYRTSSAKWALATGNVLLPPPVTGLPKPSVANVSQIITLNKADLTGRAEKLPKRQLESVISGIDFVLGRRGFIPATPACSPPSVRQFNSPRQRRFLRPN